MTEISIHSPFTAADKTAAADANRHVRALVYSIRSSETELATNYVKLGELLLAVRDKHYWVLWGHNSFGAYLQEIGAQVGKGRTQLYGAISISEKLLPSVPAADLEKMGFSKALELKRALASKGSVSAELVEKATNPKVTIDELRAEVFKSCHLPESDKGSYLDFGGCYLSTDEREEVKQAFGLAARLDPPLAETLPAPIRTREIFLRLCREFTATYGASA